MFLNYVVRAPMLQKKSKTIISYVKKGILQDVMISLKV